MAREINPYKTHIVNLVFLRISTPIGNRGQASLIRWDSLPGETQCYEGLDTTRANAPGPEIKAVVRNLEGKAFRFCRAGTRDRLLLIIGVS